PLITFPANTQSYQRAAVGHIGNATQLRGTASDAGVNPSGIKGVGIRLSYLLATNTYYWTGTTFSSYTVTAATAWQTAGAAAWNYNNTIGSDITWPVDLSHAMKLEANATDFATLEDGTGSGNIGPITTINFNVDFVAPAGALTWPGANAAVSSAAVQMTGSETDDLSGVNTLQVEISTGLGASKYYWTGSSYTLNQTWITTTTANPWYYTLPASALANGLYYARLQLTDFAGNPFTTFTSTFTYNTTAPTVTIN